MRRTAFTLVELLAATALATLLMLVVLAVLSGLAKDRKLLLRDERQASASAADAAADLIRQDLAQAERIRVGAESVELFGFGSLDRVTLAPTHRPVRVVYRVEAEQGRRWLVREQTDLDLSNNRDRWSERVCVGVDRLRVLLEPEEADGTQRPAQTSGQSAPGGQSAPRGPGGPGRVGTVSVASAATTAPAEPGPPAARVFGAADGRPVPAKVELVLESDEPGGVSLDRVIRVR